MAIALRRRIGCAALALVLLATACAKVGTTASGERHSWTRAGVLRIGSNYDVKSLNPVLDGSALSLDVSMFVYSWAVRYDGAGRPVPDALREIPTLANGDVSKDGRTLTYKLRPNINFQDGKPLTCDDLTFTWRFVMNPKTNVRGDGWVSRHRPIDCQTPLVAVIHMKRLYAPYLQQLWGVNSNAPILPAHVLAPYLAAGTQNTAPFNAMPVGSGPFKVIQWERGTFVRLAANPNYFLGKPKLNEVDFYYEPDENTLETQMQTHAIDLLARGTPINWPADLPGAGGATEFRLESNRGRFVRLRSHRFQSAQSNSRGSSSAARARLRDESAQSSPASCTAPIHRPIPPSRRPHGATPRNTVHYSFDPAKARAMLDADGWHVGRDGVRVKSGQRLEFDSSTQTESTIGRAALQAVLQREWHEVGVQADVKNFPTAQFFANGNTAILEGGHYDAATFAWFGAADPDLDPLYSADNLAPRGQNSLFWVNPAATKALGDALATVDQAKRKADYVIFQQQLAIDVPTIIIGFRKLPYVYNTDLQGFDPSPVISPFWNPWEYAI